MMTVTDPRPGWDETRLDMARILARRSKCVRSQVGAVITNADNHILSEGYNGPPGTLPDTEGPCSEWCPRSRDGVGVGTQEFSACEALHGEENAIIRADLSKTTGGVLYCTRLPCISCSRRIAATGVARLVYRQSPEDSAERVAQVVAYLKLVGVDVLAVPDALDPR